MDLQNYEEVKDRIPKFFNKFKDGRIITRLISDGGDFERCRYICQLFANADDQAKGLVLATGHAFEIAGGPTANKANHEENCETSAIGRALANIGLSGNQRASKEEMTKVSRQGPTKKANVKADKISDKQIETIEKISGSHLKEVKKKFDYKNMSKKQGSNLISALIRRRAKQVTGKSGDPELDEAIKNIPF